MNKISRIAYGCRIGNFLDHSDLTEIILDSCFNVMNDRGVGFLEAVYKNSLVVSLRRKNLFVETEKTYEIFYQNQRVGFYRADIVVEESVTVEAKYCKELASEHSDQLINYLKASGIKVGLLINFGKRKIQFKRLCHPDYYPAAVGDPAYLDQ